MLSSRFLAAGGILLSLLAAVFYNSIPAVVFPSDKVDRLYSEWLFGNGEEPVVIVTGSTGGIGLELAKQLYFEHSATVIIASRNLKKCKDVVQQFKERKKSECHSRGDLLCPGGVIRAYALDTSDLDSVINFSEWVKSNFDRVNFLINNAGIHYGGTGHMMNLSTPTLSKQGYDLSFATNYLGHFLLTKNLLPMITDRVINVASMYHFQSDGQSLRSFGSDPPAASIGTFIGARGYQSRLEAYSVSKLAQVLHAKELQRRLSSDGNLSAVKILSVCPGWVGTNIAGKSVLGKVINTFGFPVREGVLVAMAAMFDKGINGGAFASNTKALPFFSFHDSVVYESERQIMHSMIALVQRLNIRFMLVNMLAGGMLFWQRLAYGFNIIASSAESEDVELAKELFDWTDSELTSLGY